MNLQMTVTRRFVQFATAIALCFPASVVMAQWPLFNGAEGFGGTFTGSAPARGWFSSATVDHVANLNDGGAGSSRDAFVENSSNKIIVFDVGARSSDRGI